MTTVMRPPPSSTDEAAAVDAVTVDVVAFGPHPDDVELCCGGLVAKLAALGHRVAIVDLTRGEAATNGTVEERAQEAAAAARILGVAHRESLALPDAGLRADDDAQLASIALALLRLRPELVLAPWAVERHPDHEAAHALVRRAVFLAGLRTWPRALVDAAPTSSTPPAAPHRPRTTLWYPMRHLERASFVVDVSAHHDTKLAAVRAHASQVAPAAATLVGSALSLSSLAARDAFYGAHIGVAFGEPYVVDEALAIDDPVAHFRGRPAPLYFPARAGGA